ncbi:MAG: hypothetical protein OQK24_04830 [Magnetovibrio sp.]|nr:hypothetical protein [Magnetovibrio sp.]
MSNSGETQGELHRIYDFHKDHQALGERVGKTLEAMKQDGSFDQITEQAEQNLIKHF